MNIILWRHAEAEDGKDDLARELTPKGRKQAEKMAAKLREKLPEHFELWVSQAVRSQQTAAFLGKPSLMLPEINPDVDALHIAPLLLSQDESATIVVVGHQPWIGDLCAFFLNQNWQQHAYWSVKKGAFWWFEGVPHDGVLLAKLRLMLAP